MSAEPEHPGDRLKCPLGCDRFFSPSEFREHYEEGCPPTEDTP